MVVSLSHNFSPYQVWDNKASDYKNKLNYSFAVGANLRAQLFKNTSVRFGLTYGRKRLKYPVVLAECNFVTPSIYVLNREVWPWGFDCYPVYSFTEHILQVPILMEYSFLSHQRLSFYVLGGIAINSEIHEEFKIVNKAGEIESLDSEASLRDEYNIYRQREIWGGFGLNYKINDRFRLNIEAMLKVSGLDWDISPISASGFGLGTNIVYAVK